MERESKIFKKTEYGGRQERERREAEILAERNTEAQRKGSESRGWQRRTKDWRRGQGREKEGVRGYTRAVKGGWRETYRIKEGRGEFGRTEEGVVEVRGCWKVKKGERGILEDVGRVRKGEGGWGTSRSNGRFGRVRKGDSGCLVMLWMNLDNGGKYWRMWEGNEGWRRLGNDIGK